MYNLTYTYERMPSLCIQVFDNDILPNGNFEAVEGAVVGVVDFTAVVVGGGCVVVGSLVKSIEVVSETSELTSGVTDTVGDNVDDSVDDSEEPVVAEVDDVDATLVVSPTEELAPDCVVPLTDVEGPFVTEYVADVEDCALEADGAAFEVSVGDVVTVEGPGTESVVVDAGLSPVM